MHAHLCIEASVAIFVACAHPASAPAPRACQRYDVDPSWTSRAPVYQSCDVDVPAQIVSETRIDRRSLGCEDYSATVRFVIDATGAPEPSTITAVEYTSAAFGDALVDAVRQWRFRPAQKGGMAVRQVTQVRLDARCNPLH